MIQWAKFASKAAKLGKKAKAVAKQEAMQIKGEYKGVKKFAKRNYRKFKNIDKSEIAVKGAFKALDYPYTTGIAIGVPLGLALPGKKKNGNGK